MVIGVNAHEIEHKGSDQDELIAFFVFGAFVELPNEIIEQGDDFLRRGGAGNVEITGGFPVDLGADTLALLAEAAKNERQEHSDVYPAFAAVAREEGFGEIARKLEQIAQVENCHAGRFEAFQRLLASHKLFVSNEDCAWICLNCGHEFNAKAAPQNCPVCGEAGYFIRVEMSPYSYQ